MIPLGILGSAHKAAAASGYDAAVLADSPLAFWPMNDGTGAPQDATGNGRHMTVTGGTPTWQTDPTLGTVLDVSAGSLTHPVRVPQTAYSYELWMRKTGTAAANSTMLSDWGGSAGSNGAMIYFDGATTTKIFHKASSVAGPTVNDSLWRHVVVTWDGTTVRTYVNGTAGGTLTISTAPSLGQTPYVSSYGNTGTGRFFPGYLCRIAWYDQALTPARISAHYAAG